MFSRFVSYINLVTALTDIDFLLLFNMFILML